MKNLIHSIFAFDTSSIPSELLLPVVLIVSFFFFVIGMRIKGVMMQIQFGRQIANALANLLQGGRPVANAAKTQSGGSGSFLLVLVILGFSSYVIYNFLGDEPSQESYKTENTYNDHEGADELRDKRSHSGQDQQETRREKPSLESMDEILPEDDEEIYKQVNNEYQSGSQTLVNDDPSTRLATTQNFKSWQVAAVSNQEFASDAAQKLKASFPNDAVYLYWDENRRLTKILVGRFSNEQDGKRLKRQLLKSGEKCFEFDLQEIPKDKLIIIG